MARPRGRVPIYSDSSLRVVRHVSLCDAINMTYGTEYEMVDEKNIRRGLLLKTQRVPLRPEIAITITASEVLMNARVVRVSPEKLAEVRGKITHYNDEGMTVGCFCPWPKPQEGLNFNRTTPEVGAALEHDLDPGVRLYLLNKLGIQNRI